MNVGILLTSQSERASDGEQHRDICRRGGERITTPRDMLGSVYYCVEGEAERLRLHCNKNASCITALDRISPSIQPPTQKNHYDGYFQQMWVLQKVAIITIIFIQSVKSNQL